MTLTTYGTQVTVFYTQRDAAILASGASPNPAPPFDFVQGTLIVGDGNGGVPTLTQLIGNGGVLNEVWRGKTISAVNQDANAANQIDIQCVVPDLDPVTGNPIGGFWIREFAILDETGQLCVVGTINVEKLLPSQGALNTLVWFAAIKISSTNNVTITPPSANFASMGEVENAINTHQPDCQAPLTKTDTTDSAGWLKRIFGLRPASMPAAPAQGQQLSDVNNTGYGRPATDAEVTAGGPAANTFQLPWVTIPQLVARTLLPGIGIGIGADRKINLDFASLNGAAPALSDIFAILRPAAGQNPAAYHQTTLAALFASLPTGLLNVQKMTASGTYTPDSRAKMTWLILIGPGGPGGASNGAANLVGSGGEAGCTVWKFFDPRVTGPLPVTLAAPSAPSPANAASNTQAPAPSLSTVGAIAAAPGGKAGFNSYGFGGPPPPTGVAGALGDFIFPGNPGEGRRGDQNDYWAGNGGASFGGGAGVGFDGSSPWAGGPGPGYAATGYGSGGGGGDSSSQQPVQGGAGGPSVAAFFEFG